MLTENAVFNLTLGQRCFLPQAEKSLYAVSYTKLKNDVLLQGCFKSIMQMLSCSVSRRAVYTEVSRVLYCIVLHKRISFLPLDFS